MRSTIIFKSAASDSDIEKISRFARRPLSADEVYTFSVALCDNDIDRDFEKFSVDALEQLKDLFVGRTGIFDHSMKAGDQRARIFDTYIERDRSRKTSDGEEYCCLMAKAYMLNNEENAALIADIDAGIKKEVSVSCSMQESRCSVCNADRRGGGCSHIRGRRYDGAVCYDVLSQATDAYEFSFVAVPAQRSAGIRKSFDIKESKDMSEIIKSISSCTEDMTISKAQAMELSSYIEELKEEARLGEDYKKQLTREVVALFSKCLPDIDAKLFASVTSVMTTKELLGFREGLKRTVSEGAKPQLMTSQSKAINNSEFKI